MAGQLGGTPILILKEGSERTRGKEAQNRNILAAKAVASAVRTTLGPKGMDKMLVDSLGDVVITNDGATILKEMDIEHPAAKMMVEIAKTQDDEVGDGTTTAVVIAGELLKKAEDLLEQDIHPTVIASGYRLAADKAYEILNEVADDVSPDDKETLLKVARTAMTGKGAEVSRDELTKLAVDAVTAVVEEDGTVDIDNVKVEKKMGGGVEDTVLIDGIVIDKERVHPNMPKKVENAKIALLNCPIEIEKTEVDAKIEITSPDQLKLFLDEEEKMLREMVEKIKSTGANVLFCQKGIDDIAQHYLAKNGILAVRRVKESDMKKLGRATGGRVVSSVDELEPADLGEAGLVEERKIGGDEMIFVERCKNPKAVSLLLRGGTEHVVDELERGMHDALRVVGVAIEDKKVIAGGGSPETELALRLRDYASTIGGREQLAIEAFADALEIIPRTLAENAGLDPIDMLVALRSAHESGNKHAGIDVMKGEIIDMAEAGVLEPVRVKTQAVSSATEAAVMILRIDDVIAAAKSSSSSGGPGGGPGGEMGGMGGGGMDFE
ncbi:MAG TPA: thermosome subunit [Candidatus Syntrophoarchaeum butanivorans]|uniref:T-complex protein 1 subunit alpha n=1 Tax=Candidatus Syntropharchaeum butanivorans TaxID=1839936 RepID=A0A7J2S368_9EURY|nr:thermosome subunit [Candidatus Syntrophoarchaeum butanivorans]